MTVPLACDSAGRLIAKSLDQLQPLIEMATCVAVGPGLSRSDELTQLVRQLYTSVPQPLVIDADGLNALAAADGGLAGAAGPRILTPHPGEFARLAKAPADSKPSRDQQQAAALDLAIEHQLTIVLKGHRTYITDGTREAFNTTGNPGMATGGTGDVLTGVITALVCQGLAVFDAAVLGAHVHGLAGDLAAQALGEVSLIATDLVSHLSQAFQTLRSTE
jgi:NAD(P)H-hydrate epimerase